MNTRNGLRAFRNLAVELGVYGILATPFQIVFSAGYGTLTHGPKGNVGVLMALVMQTGAAIGAQLGALGTRHVGGPHLRIAFAFLPLLGAILLIANLRKTQ